MLVVVGLEIAPLKCREQFLNRFQIQEVSETDGEDDSRYSCSKFMHYLPTHGKDIDVVKTLPALSMVSYSHQSSSHTILTLIRTSHT